MSRVSWRERVLRGVAFRVIDVWYVLAGRISPLYLADAIAELALLAALALTGRRLQGPSARPC